MDIKDVENLAALARLELAEKEKKELLSDMDSILGYIKQIEGVKIKEVKPEYNLKNIWREDGPEQREFSKELILEQFPDSQDRFLKVKKIL